MRRLLPPNNRYDKAAAALGLQEGPLRLLLVTRTVTAEAAAAADKARARTLSRN